MIYDPIIVIVTAISRGACGPGAAHKVTFCVMRAKRINAHPINMHVRQSSIASGLREMTKASVLLLPLRFL